MSYTKTTWVNNQAPAINADNLNHMEQGIESAHNQIDINTSDIDSLETQTQNNTQNIATETSTRQSQDSLLQSQIDQLVAPTGEAPTPAEIENARIGDDGVTYDTLGNAIRGQFSDVKSALKHSVGNATISEMFELGNITIGVSGFTYNNSPERVRTKQNKLFFAKKGVAFGLSDYTNARYMYAGYKQDGTYTRIASWSTTDTVPSQDMFVVMLVANTTDTIQTDETALASLVFGLQAKAFDYIDDNIDAVQNMSKVGIVEHSGYISSVGSILSALSESKEVYTDCIPIEQGDVFNFSISYQQTRSSWIAYCLYDSDYAFISRTVLSDSINAIKRIFTVNISNANAKYIAFTYRTYGESDVKILSTSNVSILDRFAKGFINPQLYLINTNIKSINHRGYNYDAPENTIPAFKLSKLNGFNYVETDVNFTSDGVAVLLHDSSINRTARNADGTAISGTVNINDITYEQACEYDFGIWKSDKYAGTKIPTFEEFLTLCRKIGLKAYVELKDALVSSMGQKIQGLVDMVKKCGMDGNVTWISLDRDYLEVVKNYDSKARIGLIASSNSQTALNNAVTLKTANNEVFVDASSVDATMVDSFISNGIGLEVWTVNAISSLTALDPYVNGVTSDYLIAGYELFKRNINL